MSEEEECLRRNGTYGTASPCGVVADAMFSNYTSSLDSNYTVNCTANTEAGRLLYSPYFQAAIYFSYCSIFVAALCGNGLVCYVVHSSPRMRTVTNYFIANLAVGDVLMTLFCVPFSFVSVLILQHWPFGDSMCKIVSYSQAVSVLVSAYTLVAISLDRYMAIMRPLRPRLFKRGAGGAVVGVWVFALATAAPIPIVSRPTQPSEWYVECSKYMCHEDWPSLTQSYHYSMVLMALQYFMPLSVLVATYARIAVVVWGKRTPGEAENTRDQRMARSKRKRKHPGYVRVFELYKVERARDPNGKRSLKGKAPEGNPMNGAISVRQPQLQFPTTKKGYSKAKFDELIKKCSVCRMRPLPIVDDPSFINILEEMDFGVKVIDRRGLGRRIKDQKASVIVQINEKLKAASYVSTTADIWSTKTRNFFGVTAHWIGERTLKRHSAALTCRRFRGPYTHDKIAEMLGDIHDSFGLSAGKIVSKITDNGANFSKAFKMFWG